MSEVSVLEVLLYDEPVGTLTRVGDDRTLFSFNQSYIDDQYRPTLSLGFKDSLGGLMTDFKPVRTKVMPFFSNLLPEGHMRVTNGMDSSSPNRHLRAKMVS
ncbi:HipA N-terminal domain-containing protein, partial [Haliea atlantica]